MQAEGGVNPWKEGVEFLRVPAFIPISPAMLKTYQCGPISLKQNWETQPAWQVGALGKGLAYKQEKKKRGKKVITILNCWSLHLSCGKVDVFCSPQRVISSCQGLIVSWVPTQAFQSLLLCWIITGWKTYTLFSRWWAWGVSMCSEGGGSSLVWQ